MNPAIQELYPEDVSHCYGCGRLNLDGLQIKTYEEGQDTVTRFTPRKYHTAVPGYVYGGLIASLIDCHSTATAAAALYRAEGREPGSDPAIRCLTASLHVDYLRPTPINAELVIRGRAQKIDGRRVTVAAELYAADRLCARGEVVAVGAPKSYFDKLAGELASSD